MRRVADEATMLSALSALAGESELNEDQSKQQDDDDQLYDGEASFKSCCLPAIFLRGATLELGICKAGIDGEIT